MTKADLMRVLERVPMNAPVMFVDVAGEESMLGAPLDVEYEPRAAFTVMIPRRGLVVLLTEGQTPGDYVDQELEVC